MTTPTSELEQVAEEQHAAQAALVAAMLYEVVQLWQVASMANPNLWLSEMVELILSTSVELAEQLVTFYDEYRTEVIGTPLSEDALTGGVTPGRPSDVTPDRPVLPEGGFDSVRELAESVAPQPAQIRRALTYLGPVNAEYRASKGWTDTAIADTGLVNVSGAAMRLALEAAREVVPTLADLDREAIGYRRITMPGCCSWCAMLATRGVMTTRGNAAFFYESRDTAGRNASDRFVGAGDYKFHDHCRCTVVPVFRADEPLRPIEQEYLDLYQESTADYTGQDKIRAFRRAFEARYGRSSTF